MSATETTKPAEPKPIIYSCSGCSDAGELADLVARRLSKQGVGEMSCLAGIGGRVKPLMRTAQRAQRIVVVVVDGCPLNCARHTLQNAGFEKFQHVELHKLGHRKGSCPVTEERVSEATVAAKNLIIEHLNKTERKLVEGWKSPTSQLAAICRNGAIYASLHYLGVFEVDVDVADDDLPAKAQEKAFQDFISNEKTICEAIVQALLRYYDFARKKMPDWFDYFDPEDRRDKPSVAQFTKLIEFDGVTVCGGSAKGFAPLLFGWEPIWDMEHKLSTLVYRGEVIAIDSDASDLLDDDPEEALKSIEKDGWGRPQMTVKEKSALKEFISTYEAPEEDDD